MSLFQRIRTPFGESAEDNSDQFHAPQPHRVGVILRQRREELDLDLDSVGEALCIKPLYIDALEQGRAQDLPGPAYASGFIRAYAHYLGLDEDRVLDSYKAESADVRVRPDLALPVPLAARSLPGGPILLVGAILALCGYGTWYYLSTGERSRPERVAAVPAELRPTTSLAASDSAPGGIPAATVPAPRLSTGLGATPDEAAPAVAPAAPRPVAGLVSSPAAAALPPQPTGAAPAPTPATGSTGQPAAMTTASLGDSTAKPGAAAANGIDIKAIADCWIQIRAADDQSLVFSRVLKAGETYHVPRGGLFLRTGNAGALSIIVDGKPAPAIGGVGMLRRNVALDPQPLLAGTAVHG